jgi:ABC-type oligopeptide transport system ATPase subunit
MSALLELNDLKKHFLVRSGPLGLGTTTVRAVDGVSFHIDRGETLALVGDLLRQNPLPKESVRIPEKVP